MGSEERLLQQQEDEKGYQRWKKMKGKKMKSSEKGSRGEDRTSVNGESECEGKQKR